MKRLISTALLLLPAAFSTAAEPAQPADPQTAELREYYDKAFGLYLTGDYAKAMEYWNMVLKTDPKQVTAKNMIEEARQKLAGSSASMKDSFYSLVRKGRYSDALLKIENMLSTDPTNQNYAELQNRLRVVSAITPQKPSSSKPWKLAADGLSAWLNEKEDTLFAYDALRYAFELSPGEKRFQRLVTALEEEFPQLKQNDTKPPNVSVLDNKKDVALHHIYDSKFYLAVKELEGALRLEADDVVSLKRLGSAYLQLKEYQKARDAWQRASALAPDDLQLKEYIAALDKAAPPGQAETKKQPRRRKRG